jgi:hypothetical protein
MGEIMTSTSSARYIDCGLPAGVKVTVHRMSVEGLYDITEYGSGIWKTKCGRYISGFVTDSIIESRGEMPCGTCEKKAAALAARAAKKVAA